MKMRTLSIEIGEPSLGGVTGDRGKYFGQVTLWGVVLRLC